MDWNAAADLAHAVWAVLPPVPDVDAKCHQGLCAQEDCAHCLRLIRASNALRQLQRAACGDTTLEDVAKVIHGR